MHVVRPQEQELSGVLPGLDPANTGEVKFPFLFVLYHRSEGGDFRQRDRLDRRARVATGRRGPFDARLRPQRVEVDPGDRVDCVYRREAASSALQGCPPGLGDAGDVWAQLGPEG